MGKVNESMQLRPFLWAFWANSPAKGRIAFFDKGWHRLILPHIRDAWKLSPSEASGFYDDANAFERQLTDDGTLIIKFFLQIDKDEQRRRFAELEKSPDTAWRVDANDREQNRRYDQHKLAYELLLSQTSVVNPWHIIEANDNRRAVIAMLRRLIKSIEGRINVEAAAQDTAAPLQMPSVLKTISLNKTTDDYSYKKDMAYYQEQLTGLGFKLYAKHRPVILVFEGWDAAGKGGCIKRLAMALDPRAYKVVTVAAPSAQELSHHYLWRFFTKMPKDGHLAIFDRSWYGRVLVERVESLTPQPVWRRAYQEINEMEAHLVHHGAIVLKFWLHIDPDEQLRRFTDRQQSPLKQYKITDEDWRNREKWSDYEKAVDEMLARTHTPNAPWVVVEANNKKYARVKVLKTVVEKLESVLNHGQ
jgi:polyphosphate:AMP phosphotransferase